MPQKLSNLALLSMSMQAQPGVYALLLGSGVSTGAGIPTAWEIVKDLVGRVAAASSPDDQDAYKTAWEDSETWWSEHDEEKLGYSTLLEKLASTAAARQGLLAEYFEPSKEERDEGLKQPSAAHKAIAELVKAGYVRVILTTNFDRLMEQALADAGVSFQVISRSEAVDGMLPLAHSALTLIKLHGDYKDIDTRNTSIELKKYPDKWNRLLGQVFDEYGLVIAGWSADWDEALVDALQSAPNRRYPLYWDSRSSKGENAKSLLINRSGVVVPADNADKLFTELFESVNAIEKLPDSPISTAMAIARLKHYLPDLVRRIDIHDLVMNSVDNVIATINKQETSSGQGGVVFKVLQDVYAEHFSSMDQLARLLITGVWHDTKGEHDQLWADVLKRLIDEGTKPIESANYALESARLLPALITLSLFGVTAIHRDREALLIKLATRVEGKLRIGDDEFSPAAQILGLHRVFEDGWIKALPRWEDKELHYPVSHLMVTDLWSYFSDFFSSKDDYISAYHGFEYRLGLIQELMEKRSAIIGEYLRHHSWKVHNGVKMPKAEIEFRRRLATSSSTAWQEYMGGAEKVDSILNQHREEIAHYSKW